MAAHQLSEAAGLHVPANLALEHLRAWIGERRFMPGSRLPSERDLAERLKVTRFVVRAALAQLEDEGLIRCASERIRVVTDALTTPVTVMGETVALFTHLKSRPIPGEEGPARMVQMLYVGITEALQAAGLNVLTVPPERAAAARIQRLIAQRPLGWIVLDDALGNEFGRSVLSEVRAQGLPTVVYGDVLDGPGLEHQDAASSDQRGGSRALTEWLIARGCRRIVRFSDNPVPQLARQSWRALRDLGYRDACVAAGIPVLPVIESVRLTDTEGSRVAFEQQVRITSGFLHEHFRGAQPADAIMAISDGLVFDIIAACRLLGREPNREVAIVGYDNYWQGSPQRQWESTAPLATVDKNLHEVGGELVRLLLDRVAGKLPTSPQKRVVAAQLMTYG